MPATYKHIDKLAMLATRSFDNLSDLSIFVDSGDQLAVVEMRSVAQHLKQEGIVDRLVAYTAEVHNRHKHTETIEDAPDIRKENDLEYSNPGEQLLALASAHACSSDTLIYRLMKKLERVSTSEERAVSDLIIVRGVLEMLPCLGLVSTTATLREIAETLEQLTSRLFFEITLTELIGFFVNARDKAISDAGPTRKATLNSVLWNLAALVYATPAIHA